MRMQRIKEVSDGFYHIVSRIVDRRMILDTSDPKDYRFSGYGEAMAGSKKPHEGRRVR